MSREWAIDHEMGGELTTRQLDRAVAEIARRQHGVVARRQLAQLGMGRRAVDERLGRGHLHPLYRAVYAVGHRRISEKGRWMAAVLTAPDACLSHRSAGRFWRILPPSAEWPEVTVPAGRGPRRPGLVAHRSLLAADERTRRDGIDVTSVFRTLLDLAGVLEARQLERALNEVKARGLTDRLSIQELLRRHGGRRGTARLRRLTASEKPEGITRNDFEEAFLTLVDRHGLPRPRMNAPLSLRGRFYEIDALWSRERVALELDGRRVHGTPRGFESDRRRDRILLAEGWRTMRVTWRQLRDEPEAIATDLRLALAPPGRLLHVPALPLERWTGSSSSTT